ncbi:MAG: dihydrofolate reductase [Nanoarchaeota archaeon]
MIAITAISKNRVIGNNGEIPWHSKEDFAHFRETTLNKTILVGRKTFENLPFLEKRNVDVLSNSKEPYLINKENLVGTIRNINNINLDHYFNQKNLILCGGRKIYGQFLAKCSKLYLTEFDFEVEGDTYFPFYELLFSKIKLIKEITDGKIFEYARNSFTKEK